MQTTTERLEGNTIKLTVTVPSEEVDAAVGTAYKGIANEMKIPGFRKGKVPSKVIDNYVGKDRVLAEAQEHLIGSTYPRAIDMEGIRPIDEPDMGELALPVEGAEYVYSAEVAVRPELTVTTWDGISVTAPHPTATDEEVEAKVEETLDRFASLEPVEDRGIGESDFALISFTGTVDGEEFEGNSVDQFLYEMGSGQMPTAFDEQLTGAEVGDSVTVTFEIPETSSRSDFVGKEAIFEVDVHEIKAKVLPEIDDELAQNAGYDSTDEMREKIRAQLDAGKQMMRAQTIEVEARRALAENMEGEIPESMVSRRLQDMIRDFFNSLESQGISPEQYTAARDMSLSDLEEQFQEEAEQSIRGELVLEALFRALDMELTEEDIDAELSAFSSSDSTPAEMREKFEKAGVMAVISEQAMQRKATGWLLDHIEIVEEERE